MKGTYIVIAELNAPAQIRIGKKARLSLERGFYGYVGSAMGGIESRIERHLSRAKKLHWHIDYLLRHAVVQGVTYGETDHKEECHIAQMLRNSLTPIPGFGCSDYTCSSHLFFSESMAAMKARAIDAFRRCGCHPLQYRGGLPINAPPVGVPKE